MASVHPRLRPLVRRHRRPLVVVRPASRLKVVASVRKRNVRKTSVRRAIARKVPVRKVRTVVPKVVPRVPSVRTVRPRPFVIRP